MKNLITIIFLIILLGVFSLYILNSEKTKTILSIYTPTKLGIDLDGNGTLDSDETICIDNIEGFSLTSDDEFYNKYSKGLNLSKTDMISLGFLAEEYAQKTLQNQKVTLKPSDKVTSECKYAEVKLNGINYKEILTNSGYGIVDGKIGNNEKFIKNLESARKLHLVTLNHKSGKYHTLDCPYGHAAHDVVIIPEKQLPKNAKPCKFCHEDKKKFTKIKKLKKGIDIVNIPNIPQPKLVHSDGGIKLLYTDFTRQLKPNTQCNSNVCKELVKTIDLANETIDIAIYGYNEVPAVTNALTRAKNRGVRIRFVFDSYFEQGREYYLHNNVIMKLANQYRSDKTESKTSSNMLMHNKFLIIDNKITFTGSMNISPTGLSGYDVNDVVIINSKEISEVYTREFEQMLNGKFHKQKAILNLNNRFKLGDSEVEVYFSPQNKTSGRIIELIKQSKYYIYIPAFLITHKGITDELIKAHNRGVDVRIIIDANSTTTRNSKHIELRHSGIMLKTENYAGKMHSKTMIIDDEYLIIGSMNFSNSGENKNDENSLIIKNSGLAKAHKEFFLYLWTMIPNKYLTKNVAPESPDSIGSCSDGVDNNFNGLIDKAEGLCQTKSYKK